MTIHNKGILIHRYIVYRISYYYLISITNDTAKANRSIFYSQITCTHTNVYDIKDIAYFVISFLLSLSLLFFTFGDY